MDDEPLTDEQAEAMLARLRKHYRQPVMPIRRYCDALRTWARVAARTEFDEKTGGHNGSSATPKQIRTVFLALRKSNLLWRLLYAGEDLRERKCPKHDGKWSGIPWKDDCPCGLTGWLPNSYEADQPSGAGANVEVKEVT